VLLSLYLAVLDDQSDEEQFIDAAVDEQAALDALETFAQNWDNKYPKIAKSWRENWTNLSTYFKYPPQVRRLIYTTNTIEGFNRQLRKVTKSKSVFQTDDSLLKMLYLAMMVLRKSGRVGGKTGAASMRSCPSISLIVCRINTCCGGMSRVYERLRHP